VAVKPNSTQLLSCQPLATIINFGSSSH